MDPVFFIKLKYFINMDILIKRRMETPGDWRNICQMDEKTPNHSKLYLSSSKSSVNETFVNLFFNLLS